MMDTAKSLLVKELSLARDEDEQDVAQQVEKMFS